MYCIKCGTNIEDKYRYCPKCGALKYKKEEPMGKKIAKILYYLLIVEVVVSLIGYTISTLALMYDNAETIEIILNIVEMVITNIVPIVAIFMLKKLSEQE